MIAYNPRTAKVLSSNVICAADLLGRMLGLIRNESLCADESLWIRPCKGIHTFGMKFSIDVAFLDSRGRVVWMREALPPGRLSRVVFSAKGALELKAGALRESGTRPGDVITFLHAEEGYLADRG